MRSDLPCLWPHKTLCSSNSAQVAVQERPSQAPVLREGWDCDEDSPIPADKWADRRLAAVQLQEWD